MESGVGDAGMDAGMNNAMRPAGSGEASGLLWRGGDVRTSVRPGELTGTVAAGRDIVRTDQHERLTKAARTLVAQTFFGTMLKEMRNSPFKSELLSGGRGGEAFSSMHDQYLAERMANGAGRRLAESIVKHLEKRLAAGKTGLGIRDSGFGLSARETRDPRPETRSGASHWTEGQ